MRIRSGFVSNSSTSSYVLLGYHLNDRDDVGKMFGLGDVEELYEHVENLGLNLFHLEGHKEGGYLVGVTLADAEYGEFDDTETDYQTLQKQLQEIKETLKMKEEPKLFIGTRMT